MDQMRVTRTVSEVAGIRNYRIDTRACQDRNCSIDAELEEVDPATRAGEELLRAMDEQDREEEEQQSVEPNQVPSVVSILAFAQPSLWNY